MTGALALAGSQVAAVRDDPAGRLALMARVYVATRNRVVFGAPDLAGLRAAIAS